MDNEWSSLGFEKSPYLSEELDVSEEGKNLFVGRTKQEIEFQTAINSNDSTLIFLSGERGVGKTSFFNVQQYKYLTNQVPYGALLVPCFFRLSIGEYSNDIDEIAGQLVRKLIYSIGKTFEFLNKKPSKSFLEMRKWISHSKDDAGGAFNFELLSFGIGFSRNYTIPDPSGIKLENCIEVLDLLQEICFKEIGSKGIIISIDNTEDRSISVDRYVKIFMELRDTFFRCKNFHWVVIGDSRTMRKIEGTDTRIGQRLKAHIEIPRMSAEELSKVFDIRVKMFGKRMDAVAPVSNETLEILYEASRGVVRYVLCLADQLFENLISQLKSHLHVKLEGKADRAVIEDEMNRFFAEKLFSKKFPRYRENDALKQIVISRIGESTSSKNWDTIKNIGKETVSIKDHKKLGYETVSGFQQDFIAPMIELDWLQKSLGSSKSVYRLSGDAYLAVLLGCCEMICKKTEEPMF